MGNQCCGCRDDDDKPDKGISTTNLKPTINKGEDFNSINLPTNVIQDDEVPVVKAKMNVSPVIHG